jgi:hypothetical protein
MHRCGGLRRWRKARSLPWLRDRRWTAPGRCDRLIWRDEYGFSGHTDLYQCAIVDDCNGSANLFNGWIEGNGLSGVYRVDQVDGSCLRLCPCGS